jgi:DNA polymerase-3 subunit gamma/tau
VLTRIFRISESWESLRHFFLAWKGVRTEKLEEVSARVIATILEGGRYEVEEFDALLQDLSRSEQFIPFLEELTGRLSAMLRKEGPRDHPLVSAELIGKWNGHIRDAYMRKTAFNQSGPLLLETLMYRMADTLERECRRA